jgi:hypothetical protein
MHSLMPNGYQEIILIPATFLSKMPSFQDLPSLMLCCAGLELDGIQSGAV